MSVSPSLMLPTSLLCSPMVGGTLLISCYEKDSHCGYRLVRICKWKRANANETTPYLVCFLFVLPKLMMLSNAEPKECVQIQAPFHIYIDLFRQWPQLYTAKVFFFFGMPIWIVCLYQPFLTCASISWLADCCKEKDYHQIPETAHSSSMEFSRDIKRISYQPVCLHGLCYV